MSFYIISALLCKAATVNQQLVYYQYIYICVYIEYLIDCIICYCES